jgi:protein CpxP
MNRTKLLTIAVLGLLVINLITLIFIFTNKREHHHDPRGNQSHQNEGPKKIIIDFLNFDSSQQKQYEVIIKDHQFKMKEFNRKSRELHDQLYSLLTAVDIDKTKSDTIIQQIAENQKELDNLNFDHFQKIKAICKSDQLKMFNGLVIDLTHLFRPKNGPPN